MRSKKILLEPNKIYHVYNHANANDLLFSNDGNYLYFLKKYKQYITPIADTFAYCLMPNHFHFALKIKDEQTLYDFFIQTKKIPANLELVSVIDDLPKYVSKQFGNFFNAYAEAFNKIFKRRGKLFMEDFSRKLIEDDIYYRNVIHYIHFNPVHHGFVKDLRDWKYSSFESYFSENSSNLKREEVIEWFDDLDKFYEYHKKAIDESLTIELEN